MLLKASTCTALGVDILRRLENVEFTSEWKPQTFLWTKNSKKAKYSVDY